MKLEPVEADLQEVFPEDTKSVEDITGLLADNFGDNCDSRHHLMNDILDNSQITKMVCGCIHFFELIIFLVFIEC